MRPFSFPSFLLEPTHQQATSILSFKHSSIINKTFHTPLTTHIKTSFTYTASPINKYREHIHIQLQITARPLVQSSVAALRVHLNKPFPQVTPVNSSLCQSKTSRPTVSLPFPSRSNLFIYFVLPYLHIQVYPTTVYITNIRRLDPFAEADEDTGQSKQAQNYIHIRIQRMSYS